MFPQSIVTLICSVVLAVSFAVSLSAQETDLRTFDSPDVTIEWQFGLAGKVYGSDRDGIRRDFANHVSFLITNHRDTVVEGMIDVEIQLEHVLITNLTHEWVTVGPGSTKRFSFVLSDPQFSLGRNSWNSPSFTAQPGVGVETTLKEAKSARLLWRRSKDYVVEEMMYASQLRGLVICDSSRVPMFAAPLPALSAQGFLPGSTPALGERSLDFQQVAPWQSPDSFPCLAPFNAVVLSPEMDPNSLTAAQQRALGEYVANSGILVLPSETVDTWREAIFTSNKRLPFTLQKTTDDEISLYGNGKVLTLKMPAVGTRDAVSERRLYDLIDGHLEPPLAMKFDRRFWPNQLGIHSTESAIIVSGFLVLYGVISIAALYFFRRMRRPALIRGVIVMIAFFSTGSVLMGLYLRAIPGDVEWNTLTEACAGGGAIQHGNFHFVSAGNRNQEFEVRPKETLLQPSRPSYGRYGYANNDDLIWRREGLSLNANDAYGTANISILPWGHAYWNSRLYIGAVQPLEASVQLTDTRTLRAVVTVTNPNDFPVHRAKLYLHISSDALQFIRAGRYRDSLLAVQLGSIPPKQTIAVDDPINTSAIGHLSSPMIRPISPLRGQVAGYIFGYLSSSPGVEPTPGKGFDHSSELFVDDFSHGFFQRLPPAGLPLYQELIDHLNRNDPASGTPSNSGGFIIQAP